MFKYEDFLLSGKLSEQKLADNFSKFLQTSKEEDIKGVDLSLTFTFDVKKAKKIRREDFAPSYNKTWIEYKNVRGNLGSICRENLDYFIIESIDSWVVKRRIDAFNLFKQMSKASESEFKQLKMLTDDLSVELYQPYQRIGRKDVLMLVELNHELWPTILKISKSNLSL